MINITTNVIYADMPPTIKAYTVNNNDDSFTIVLNSRLNREQHLKSYHHELTHIEMEIMTDSAKMLILLKSLHTRINGENYGII